MGWRELRNRVRTAGAAKAMGSAKPQGGLRSVIGGAAKPAAPARPGIMGGTATGLYNKR